MVVAAAKEDTTSNIKAAVLSTCKETIQTCTVDTQRNVHSRSELPQGSIIAIPRKPRGPTKNKNTETVLLFPKAKKVASLEETKNDLMKK